MLALQYLNRALYAQAFSKQPESEQAAIRGMQSTTAQILALYQPRKFSRLSRFDFAAIFAQFGRNPLKAEFRVYLFLRVSGDRSLRAKKSVLVERKTLLLRDSANMDAVSL